MKFNWLTERDHAVYEYLQNNAKYVTTSQLTELFFRKNEKGEIKQAKLICRRRMKILEQNIPGVVSLFRQASSDKIYTISNGKEHISDLARIEHSIRLNDFFIELKRHSEEKNHQIYAFKVECKLKENIIPDILLIYIKNKMARIFFIEYDRGTEPLTRIKRKIDKYEVYFMKRLFLSEDWQPAAIKPDLYFLCDKQSRADNIKALGVPAETSILNIVNF
jgi:hypothetical protein